MYLGKWTKVVAVAVAVAAGATGVNTPRLEAMTVPSHVAANAPQYDRQTDMAKVQAALENKIIRQRLADMKLTPAEIETRLARLDDRQIHKLALQADKQQAAGDAGGTILIVIAAVALLALIIHMVKRDRDDDDDDDDRDDPAATQNNTTVAPGGGTPVQTAPAQTPGTIIVK